MPIFDELGITPGNEDSGDWFDWCESTVDPATGTVTFEDPKPGVVQFKMRSSIPYWMELRKDRKKDSSFVLNPVTRQMERVTYDVPIPPDREQQEAEDMWPFSIIGARKKDEDGVFQDIEMSREDKIKLAKAPKFQRWAKRVFDILSGEVAVRKEAAIKNS